MYADSSLKQSHDKLLEEYAKSLGSSWPQFADIGWQMEPFFPHTGLPLVVLVDTQTMRIHHVSIGHHSAMLKTMIDEILGT